jgi:hypothetical protein
VVIAEPPRVLEPRPPAPVVFNLDDAGWIEPALLKQSD